MTAGFAVMGLTFVRRQRARMRSPSEGSLRSPSWARMRSLSWARMRSPSEGSLWSRQGAPFGRGHWAPFARRQRAPFGRRQRARVRSPSERSRSLGRQNHPNTHPPKHPYIPHTRHAANVRFAIMGSHALGRQNHPNTHPPKHPYIPRTPPMSDSPSWARMRSAVKITQTPIHSPHAANVRFAVVGGAITPGRNKVPTSENENPRQTRVLSMRRLPR